MFNYCCRLVSVLFLVPGYHQTYQPYQHCLDTDKGRHDTLFFWKYIISFPCYWYLRNNQNLIILFWNLFSQYRLKDYYYDIFRKSNNKSKKLIILDRNNTSSISLRPGIQNMKYFNLRGYLLSVCHNNQEQDCLYFFQFYGIKPVTKHHWFSVITRLIYYYVTVNQGWFGLSFGKGVVGLIFVKVI